MARLPGAVHRRLPVLPDTADQVSLGQWEVSNLPAPTFPTANQSLPRQEPGFRPRIP